MESTINGITQIKNGIKTGEVVGLVLGTVLFAFSMYAFSLSIKANKLTIKKLESEGYK